MLAFSWYEVVFFIVAIWVISLSAAWYAHEAIRHKRRIRQLEEAIQNHELDKKCHITIAPAPSARTPKRKAINML
jgi:hypothetical protein